MIELVSPGHLKDYILRPENTAALEDTLYWNSQEYSRVQQLRATAPSDKKLDIPGVVSLYHEVTQEVRDFLNLSNSQVGRIDLAFFDWRYYAKHGAKVGGVLAGMGLLASGYPGGISPDMVAKAAGAAVGIDVLTLYHNYTETILSFICCGVYLVKD